MKCNNCKETFTTGNSQGVPKWHVGDNLEPELVCFHTEEGDKYSGFMIKDGEDIGYTDLTLLYNTRKECAIECNDQIDEQISDLKYTMHKNDRRIRDDRVK